jgi:CYTH domain-containing protein
MKGKGGSGRPEIEQSIGVLRFKDLWEQTQGSRIYKKRMNVERNGLTIEIDDYIHRDLMVAEVEVPREELLVTIPIYGRDVTEDKNYKNRNLAR